MQLQLNDILTLVFSSGALFFSFLNYKRAGKFDNENILYEMKLEVYTTILRDLNKVIGNLESNIQDAKEFLKSPNIESTKYLDVLAEEVDAVCFRFNDYIVSHSLIIPEKIVILLSDFCDKILNDNTNNSEIKERPDIHQAEELLEELMEEANEINYNLRQDLHIDKLNHSLYRRLN